VVETPEIGSLVIGAAGSPGGSDAFFETALIGEIDGRLKEILPRHLKTTTQDAVCLGRFERGERLGVAVANFVWGDETHYAAHRYDVSLYLWNGHTLESFVHKRTARRHPSFQSALAELGIPCRDELVRALLPEFF
jgi:hypothetical protein